MDGPCKSAYVFTMVIASYSFVLFLNSIYFEFVMQQYNLDLLFTILLISSEQVYFWQDVVHKAGPWFTTRTCWSGFSRLLLCSGHVWVVCLHWSFCSTNNCFLHLFHTTLMVMLWMSPRTFWPIAFSRSSSSLWLNDLSYLFDHAFEPISLLSFFNLDVVQNVRNTWKIVLHFLNNLITTLWELKNSRLAVIVIIDNKMTCVSLKCPM
jgi:hypothetical protein